MIPSIAFVGYKKTGKTTLICKVIEVLGSKGLRIGALKHDGHEFEMDHVGTDTYDFREAGAKSVMIQSARQVAMIEKVDSPAPVSELLQRFRDVDLIIMEGFKRESIPKILLIKDEQHFELIHKLEHIQAVCTNPSFLTSATDHWNGPVFDWSDASSIAEFVYQWWMKFQS
ncbi:molybdopterin-guanine dinucleotide biosynthesis protein B [Fodinisporobacter ferrooxydans]|uniref:Molybdopterin-guanine dinucleotide biosynthesis protein B n=1 Tax=Fodinisporobacter ferrooxydans TaxID=2901836 RepID=A0ABY4CNQ5_9BACL|nr:molybdopterin-guanine dinucleotide biosynthesis protein B [Alicyclobacillaceae bacterium MYW30-H2]